MNECEVKKYNITLSFTYSSVLNESENNNGMEEAFCIYIYPIILG